MSKIQLPVEDAGLLISLVNSGIDRYSDQELKDKLRALYDRLHNAKARANRPPTKAQLWWRVARLAGELAFCDGPLPAPFRIIDDGDSVEAVRDLIQHVKNCDEIDRSSIKRHTRLIAKLEAAIKEWESAT